MATQPAAEARLETHDNRVRFAVLGSRENPATERRPVLAGFLGPDHGCTWTTVENRLCLRMPAGSKLLVMAIWFTRETNDRPTDALVAAIPRMDRDPNLRSRLGGPRAGRRN